MGQFCCSIFMSLIWLIMSVSPSGAEVKLAAVIGDNMVLQREMNVPVWGTAAPGESISVIFRGQQIKTMANSDGRWEIILNPMGAGGPFTMSVSGTNSIIVKNILVGEVWICSGQSNMERPVKNALNAEKEIADADHPKIRLLSVPWTLADRPLQDWKPGMISPFDRIAGEYYGAGHRQDGDMKWVACEPKTVRNFTAVGYFFGRELHKVLDVPVGLIYSTWDGSSIVGWTSMKTLKSYREFEPILNQWGKAFLNYPEAKEEHNRKMSEWKRAVKKAKAEGKPGPPLPWIPRGPEHHHRPAGLYNGMIAPLIPFAIRGAIWYQGEADAGRAYLYRTMFPAMIRDWRESWGQGDFPFLFAQLANFKSNKYLYRREMPEEPHDDYWAELRESQSMALTLPNTGMAVTIDVGDSDDIHPKNKQEVGRRLALSAQAVAYGSDIVSSGPVYESMTVEGNKVWLRFRHTGAGLRTGGGEKLKGFAIAGYDRKFVWAEAVIDGRNVVVGNDNVPSPVAVRYGWASDPECNLYNKEGLPASPFRTDDWPGISVQR